MGKLFPLNLDILMLIKRNIILSLNFAMFFFTGRD